MADEQEMVEEQAVVEEQYTRPQGLYRHRHLDLEELRRLILDAKLAPCHVGKDEFSHDLDECPICFLGYPSLNWMSCCKKGMCTECFLVVKCPATHSIQWCPFCVTAGASVEYRGKRTAEERMMDMEEDQKAIEAEIKARRGKEVACAAALLADQNDPSTTEAGDEMHDDTCPFAASLSNEEEQRAIEEEIRRIQEQEAFAASLADMDEQRMIEAEIRMRQEEEAYSALMAGQIAALDEPTSASAAPAPSPSGNPSGNPSASTSAAAAAPPESSGMDATAVVTAAAASATASVPAAASVTAGASASTADGSQDSDVVEVIHEGAGLAAEAMEDGERDEEEAAAFTVEAAPAEAGVNTSASASVLGAAAGAAASQGPAAPAAASVPA